MSNAKGAGEEAQTTSTEDEIAAGDGKRVAMKKRADELIAEAESLLGQLGLERADPSKLKVDREVRQAINEFNEVYVSNADPAFVYSWIYRDPTNEFGGRFVRKMQALGWEIVRGDDPEATEHTSVTTERWVADCLLMKIRVDRYGLLQKRDRVLRQAQQAGVYANVFDIAERHGVRVWDMENMPGEVASAISSQADSRRAQALAQYHRMNRAGRMDKMLKAGQIPGLPPGVKTVAAPGRVR